MLLLSRTRLSDSPTWGLLQSLILHEIITVYTVFHSCVTWVFSFLFPLIAHQVSTSLDDQSAVKLNTAPRSLQYHISCFL